MLGELACYVRSPAGGRALARAGLGARRDGVWFPDGAAPRADALAARRVDAAGQRDHHADRQPQPADDAEPRSQLDDAALRPLIDEMLHGADGTTADERAALFRMAWDFVGLDASRAAAFLYERFYLTSAARNRSCCTAGSTAPAPMRSSTRCSQRHPSHAIENADTAPVASGRPLRGPVGPPAPG